MPNRKIRAEQAQEIQQLRLRNKALADRLEALEDQSWEVRESEEVHRSAALAFGDVVVHRDLGGKLIMANDRAKACFGDTRILPQIDNAINAQPNSQHVRDIEIDTLEGQRWYSWCDMRIRDHETGEAAIRSIGRDITAHKQAEQLAESASATKSRFLAMVSHEMRTPLNGILGLTQLLKSTSLTPAQYDHLAGIDTSGRSLLALVEDLLDTAQIDAGHLVLSKKPTDLQRLLEDVAELLAHRAHGRGIMIASFFDPSLPKIVQADPVRLKQVLVNLVGNAVKFTETGSVAIEAQPGHDGRVQFTVTDTGPGMTMDECARVFGAFVQTDSGAARKNEGAGLGLSISRELVNLMDGDISVESSPGMGSRFLVQLPLEAVADGDLTLQAEAITLAIQTIIVGEAGPALAALSKTVGRFSKFVSTVPTLGVARNLKIEDGLPLVIMAQTTPCEHDIAAFISAPRISFIELRLAQHEPGHKNETASGWLNLPVRASSMERVLRDCLGANVEVAMPDLVPAKGEAPVGPAKFSAAPNRPNSLLVLLAEDNPINTLLATSLLGKLGHRVVHVDNGAAAIAAVKTQQPQGQFDLILMDKHMPECDGLTAIRAIRDHERLSQTKRAPIVVLSADALGSAQREVTEAGADSFLVKPLDIDRLATLIEQYATKEIDQNAGRSSA